MKNRKSEIGYGQSALARENFPWGSLREQRVRIGMVVSATRANIASVRANPASHPLTLILLTLGLLGAVGDGLTTYFMASHPDFYESNHVVMAGMSIFGLGPYVILAACISMLTILLVLVRGPNIMAWTLFAGGVTFLGFKLFVALANTSLLYRVLGI